MGLIAKFDGVDKVYEFFAQFFELIPVAIRSLILIAFGGMMLIVVLRSIWR